MAHLKDSKLAELLQVLSEDEFKRLKLWLQSPYANTNKKLLSFHHIIEEHFPDFENKVLDKKIVFKKLFRGKVYDNKILNNLISEFTKQVEKFLSHDRIATNPSIQANLLREIMQERKLPRYFENLTRQLIRSLNKQEVKTVDQHWQLSQLYRQLYYQPSEHHRYFSDQPILELADYHLSAFYALTKYQLLHEVQDSRSILQKKPTIQNDLSLLNVLKTELQLPALNLYHLRLQRSEELSWTEYEVFQQYYYKHFSELPPTLQQDFFFFCINDTVVLNVKGVEGALNETLKLYKYGLQHNLLLDHQLMSGVTFNNIIMAASHLAEVAFAKKFVSKYVDYLHPDLQEEAGIWAEGQLAYLSGKYNRSFALLTDKKFTHPLFKIQSRVTLVKTYFYLFKSGIFSFENLTSYYQATIQFIRRDKLLSQKRIMSYIRFIQFAERRARILHKNHSTKHLQKLTLSIHKEKNLMGKHWLLRVCSVL